MLFKLKIEPEVFDDIQEGIDWYNKQQTGLGAKFLSEVQGYFNKLKKMPFFQIRYDNVRCIPLQRFPYIIHFTINETDKIIVIRGVFNTSRDPEPLF